MNSNKIDLDSDEIDDYQLLIPERGWSYNEAKKSIESLLDVLNTNDVSIVYDSDITYIQGYYIYNFSVEEDASDIVLSMFGEDRNFKYCASLIRNNHLIYSPHLPYM
jgi:hypothetical protein